jgi:hypothetical protein
VERIQPARISPVAALGTQNWAFGFYESGEILDQLSAY